MADVLDICYLNGQFQDINSAQISVLDRGFIFGDAVYEVIPVCAGVAFGLGQHLSRLENSLSAIKISLPEPAIGWYQLVDELIMRNGGGEQAIYVQVSRGVAPRDHAITAGVEPTVLVFAMQIKGPTHNAVAAITAIDPRWQRCDIKATSLLANVLLRSQANEAGAYEAILFRDGVLTEGAASNVFIVQGGRVYTPQADERILPGITRQFLIDVLKGSDLEVIEQDIDRDMFNAADEVWLTSSSRDLVSVTVIDNEPVGNGEIGEIYNEVANRFSEFKSNFLSTERKKFSAP